MTKLQKFIMSYTSKVFGILMNSRYVKSVAFSKLNKLSPEVKGFIYQLVEAAQEWLTYSKGGAEND